MTPPRSKKSQGKHPATPVTPKSKEGESIKFTSKADLAHHIGLADIGAYDEWRESECFKPIFDEYFENVVLPEREKATTEGKMRRRLMNLVSIEAKILEGESNGRRKYSSRRLDKSQWTLLDHTAWTLYELTEENTHTYKGLFYSRARMPVSEKHNLLWSVLQFEVWDNSPSRIQKRTPKRRGDSPLAKQPAKYVKTETSDVLPASTDDDAEEPVFPVHSASPAKTNEKKHPKPLLPPAFSGLETFHPPRRTLSAGTSSRQPSSTQPSSTQPSSSHPSSTRNSSSHNSSSHASESPAVRLPTSQPASIQPVPTMNDLQAAFIQVQENLERQNADQQLESAFALMTAAEQERTGGSSARQPSGKASSAPVERPVNLDNLLASIEDELADNTLNEQPPSPQEPFMQPTIAGSATDDVEDVDEADGAQEALALLPTARAAPLEDHAARLEVGDMIERLELQEEITDRANRVENFRLTAYDVMRMERRHETFDLDDRFWQHDLLKRLDKHFEDIQALERDVRFLSAMETQLCAEDAAYRRGLEAQGAEEDDSLVTQMATEQDRQAYLHQQRMVDNEMVQPQGHTEACAYLRIANPERPRLPSMPMTAFFKFWQPVAIRWMMQMRRQCLGGILLCDSMGMGKTWEIAGMLIAVSALPFTLTLPISLRRSP